MSQTLTQPQRDHDEALHYRAMARKLADMAMQMAEAVLQDAQADPQPGADHTERFERASRTVRRAILLARKLAEPLPKPRQPATQPLTRTQARARIIRDVQDTIHRKHRKSPGDVETLEAELLDRLDRPDLEADLATRPIDEIIADLRRDLGVGLAPDDTLRVWKPRTTQDIDTLAAQAAAPLPTEPRPPGRRSKTRPRDPYDIDLPDDPAEAVDMVLAIGQAIKIRDG